MLDFSFGEILLLAVLAIVFIGPKELPVVARALARALAQLRALSHEFRAAFDELSKEAGLKDAQEEIRREVRMITGDDGKHYEAYDMPEMARPPQAPHDR